MIETKNLKAGAQYELIVHKVSYGPVIFIEHFEKWRFIPWHCKIISSGKSAFKDPPVDEQGEHEFTFESWMVLIKDRAGQFYVLHPRYLFPLTT